VPLGREEPPKTTDQAAANKALVLRFWDAVYVGRDADQIASFFNAEGRYEDAALGPEAAGVGPKGVAYRLSVGHAPIRSFDHEIHRMVAEGDVVLTEHTATWHFASGEVIPLRFVSVHVISDGRFDLWRDYWDVLSWAAGAPAEWQQHVASADPACMLQPGS